MYKLLTKETVEEHIFQKAHNRYNQTTLLLVQQQNLEKKHSINVPEIETVVTKKGPPQHEKTAVFSFQMPIR